MDRLLDVLVIGAGPAGVAAGIGAVARVEPASRAVRVTTDDGVELLARFVVACDGHFSPVRRAWQGTGPELGEWHAARQYFRGVTDRRLWVDFERDLLPGYAWVFPL